MRKIISIIFISAICVPGILRAQSGLDSLLLDEDIDFSVLSEDSLLLNELEGLSIFTLLDSILNGNYKKSQLALRLGFTSDVINAGRDLGTDQQGLNPGVSYYHKSGIFTSAIGYWNSQFDPKYNLTVLSAGYFGVLKRKLIYSFDYQHSLYSKASSSSDTTDLSGISNPFTKSVSAGLSYDFKHFYTGVDYSFLFGEESSHRIQWDITGYFKKKNFLFFDYMLFNPSFNVLFGSGEVTLTGQSLLQKFRESGGRLGLRNQISNAGFTLREFENLSRSEQTTILSDILSPDEFGLMNYGFSFPVTFRKGPWSYSMSYNYNIPIELPGEDLSVSPSGYLSLSLTYYLGF